MRVLSENSVLGSHPRSTARRVALIAAAVFFATILSAAGAHFYQANTSVLSQSIRGKQILRTAAPIPVAVKRARRKSGVWHQIGLASWYGREFQGKQTADGETYNMNDLTCAHRFLPLGTWVKVTNLHTHRWIVVRVNDRGPAPDTRIADLSSQAAHMLGMRDRGVTRVRLDVIDPQQAVEVARLDKLRLARLAAEANQPDTGN